MSFARVLGHVPKRRRLLGHVPKRRPVLGHVPVPVPVPAPVPAPVPVLGPVPKRRPVRAFLVPRHCLRYVVKWFGYFCKVAYGAHVWRLDKHVSSRKKVLPMNLEEQAKIVDTIHDTLAEHLGEKLQVRANMGRSKIMELEGTLAQIHPRLFIIDIERKRGRIARQSYQYVDILTGVVELYQDDKPLFEPFVDDQGDMGSHLVQSLLEADLADDGSDLDVEPDEDDMMRDDAALDVDDSLDDADVDVDDEEGLDGDSDDANFHDDASAHVRARKK